MQKLILAIDQGTTGTTAMLWSPDDGVVCAKNLEFEQHFPKPGWVEHDPDQIWQSVEAAVTGVIDASGVSADAICAIGITNQRETSLVWDRRDGRSLARAIVWQDRRTADRCSELKASGHEAMIRERTGLVVDPYFSGSKFEWLLNNDAALRNNENVCLGTIDAWLVFRLSQGDAHISDASNASRTMLFSLKTGDWDPELLSLFSIPRRFLPTVTDCAGQLAQTRGLGFLPDGIPITGIAGDQQSALFGQACFDAGDAKCTYGTGAFLLMNTGQEQPLSQSGLLSTVAWRLNGQLSYALEGSAFVAGSAVQWLRDGLGIIESAPEVETRAARVADTAGVMMVPALSGLGAPHWDPHARGTITGLTRGANADHLCRATLQGVAMQIVDLVDAMGLDAPFPLTALRVDGGMCKNDLFLQMQSDLLGKKVERPQNIETTAMGAIYLAALGAGIFPNMDALRAGHQLEKVFKPALGDAERDEVATRWRAAVRAARIDALSDTRGAE